MALTPQYAAIPKTGIAAISTANANRDGTGTLGTVFTAAAGNGSRIDRIIVAATGTTTAGMVRIYIYNGTSSYLYDEVTVDAVTPSSTVAAFRYDNTNVNIVLPPTYSLKASTANGEAFNVIALGGDY
jgi:hypothetical protein